MPEVRVEDEQGTVHVFPDGSTPEMIAKVLNVKPPAAAKQEPGFLDREIPLDGPVNATLSGLQSIGRGIRGAVQGVASVLDPRPQPGDIAVSPPGIPPAIARPASRVVQGIIQTGQQSADVPGAIRDINASPDPLGTYAKVAQKTAGEGAGQALTGLATEGLVRGAGLAKNALPSATRAGAALQEIKTVAGDVPINASRVGDAALELYTQAQRGATLPKAVNNLVRRMTAPDAPPLTYAEAKDFQSNISSLSANEKMNLKPNTVRLVGRLNAELKTSLADAAEVQGKGAQFTSAMKEYHDAMVVRGWSEKAISAGWKVALGALGAKEIAKIFGARSQ